MKTRCRMKGSSFRRREEWGEGLNLPRWNSRRGRELGDMKNVECIRFEDLNVNDEGK